MTPVIATAEPTFSEQEHECSCEKQDNLDWTYDQHSVMVGHPQAPSSSFPGRHRAAKDRLRETGMHDMGLVFTTEILFRPRAGTESS
jgi:hypothetical protein